MPSISFPMSEFVIPFAHNSIRTNPAWPPKKSLIKTELFEKEPVQYYIYTKNYRERSH
jgi:hypothetical protein